MKQLFSGLLLFMAISVWAQISTTRMGDLYIETTKSEIEKKIGQKIQLTERKSDFRTGYDAVVTHKGVSYQLYFVSNPGGPAGEGGYLLSEISTQSTQIKTISGMGVGNTLDELWKTYKNYNIAVTDYYLNDGDQTERVFEFLDSDTVTTLAFHFKNGKVYKVSLIVNEGC